MLRLTGWTQARVHQWSQVGVFPLLPSHSKESQLRSKHKSPGSEHDWPPSHPWPLPALTLGHSGFLHSQDCVPLAFVLFRWRSHMHGKKERTEDEEEKQKLKLRLQWSVSVGERGTGQLPARDHSSSLTPPPHSRNFPVLLFLTGCSERLWRRCHEDVMTAERGGERQLCAWYCSKSVWCINASKLVDHLTSCTVIPASQVGDTGNSLCPFLNHDSLLFGILVKVRSRLKTECLFVYLSERVSYSSWRPWNQSAAELDLGLLAILSLFLVLGF